MAIPAITVPRLPPLPVAQPSGQTRWLIGIPLIALCFAFQSGDASGQTVTDYDLAVSAFPDAPASAPVAIPRHQNPAVQPRAGRRMNDTAGQVKPPVDTLFQPVVGLAEAHCRPLFNYLMTRIDRVAVHSTAAGDICETYRVQPVIAFDGGSGEAIVTPPRFSDPNAVNASPPPPQGIVGP